MTSTALATNAGRLYAGADEFVSLLAQLVNAQGSALFEARHGHQKLVKRAVGGPQPPDLTDLGYDDLDYLKRRKQWASLSLYADGLISAVLILAFRSEVEKNAARPVLRRIMPLFESLARFVNEQSRQVKLASKISELESGIAADKIVDRAKGLLREDPVLNETTIELVDRHVARVLASSEFSQALQDRLRELEGLVAEREITARAKAVLQEQMGYTEEMAYLHLRKLSRQRRKRIAAIAREIVDSS